MSQDRDCAAPKVSVVVPVYNAGQWLRLCLDALCRQTLQEIEIICVDDGSTDNSSDILLEYATHDCRIQIVTLPRNMGPATARNTGMAAASGEYLGFVDSDDYPTLDFYEKLHAKAAEAHADVAKGNYRYWGVDGRSLPVDYSMNAAIREYKTNFSFAFCSAIYRRQLIVDHGVIFPKNQIDIEDPIFTLRIALLCSTIEIVEDAEVNIRINKDSATFGSPSLERIFAKFAGLSKILDILSDAEEIEEKSYAFITAFWFRSVVGAALQNQSPQAYWVIVHSLYEILPKIKHLEQCGRAFAMLDQNNLFAVLMSWRITRIAEYIATFYDRKKLTVARDLHFRIQNKRYGQATGASVAIPIYAPQPNAAEEASLRQCLKVFGEQHRIVFFGPKSLDTAFYKEVTREYAVVWVFEAFEDAYFKSPLTYSNLLLTLDFYSRFLCFEYMLVYQLDCWVFRDELSLWCAKGYAYIGAPWFEDYAEANNDAQLISPSGNGGFSLRKVWPFINSLLSLEKKIIDGKIDEADAIFGKGQEDYILVNLFPKVMEEFTIAPAEDAMRFSFETLPERLYTLTGELPFGCHAFAKYNPEFWRQFIPLSEYDVSSQGAYSPL